MYSPVFVDLGDAKHRPAFEGGRHRAPEAPEPSKPPERPSWASEHARPIPALPGEAATKLIEYPQPVSDALTALRLPARAQGAALEALTMPRPSPGPSLLGQCLHTLRSWWSK